jgi:hypothetical protein
MLSPNLMELHTLCNRIDAGKSRQVNLPELVMTQRVEETYLAASMT